MLDLSGKKIINHVYIEILEEELEYKSNLIGDQPADFTKRRDIMSSADVSLGD